MRPNAVICLLSLGIPVAAFAQPDPERAAALEEQIHAGIASEQTAHGAHSATLIPLLTELGSLYRDLGEEERAVAAFLEARGVVRANRGFSSLDEAPLLEELMRLEERLGLVERSWARERELLALADAHPGDLRAAEIYRGAGDRRLGFLERYLAGDLPRQLVLGCYYESAPKSVQQMLDPMAERSCTAGSRGALIRAVTAEAWQHYFAAIRTLSNRQLYSSPELQDIEMQIVRTAYERGAYRVGRQSLTRLLTYDVANAEPLLTRVDSLLQIADWDIVNTQRTGNRASWGGALDTYEQVYAKLTAEGVAAATLDELFAPPVPVVLPAFEPNPLASTRTSDTTGHIDVAFEITRFGSARRVEILGSTANAARGVTKNLVREIYDGVFRPRLVGGRVANAAPVVLRYYVTNEQAGLPAENAVPR